MGFEKIPVELENKLKTIQAITLEQINSYVPPDPSMPNPLHIKDESSLDALKETMMKNAVKEYFGLWEEDK